MTCLRNIFRFFATSTLAIVVVFFILSFLFPPPLLKPYSVVIRDRHAEFLHAFLAPDEVWRLKTSPDEIPEKLKRILIEKEDRYFYLHPGVNPFSLARAFIQNTLAGRRVSGGSTITMQVARMLQPKERTYVNKLVEMFRALQLEMTYSKDNILEIYLSMVPLGGNVEGLKSAALIYYQTPLERLNIAQLFDLILIPNDPNDLRPDRNPRRLFKARTLRAAQWIRNGFLTREDSLTLWQTSALAPRQQLPKLAPHFCLRVKGMHSHEAEIISSLDLMTQRTVEQLLSNHLRTLKPQGINDGAAILIENASRQIAAYVGSEDFADTAGSGQVDAVKALRSPGSTLKPFLYALSMDRGVLTPKTMLLDTPYDAEGFLAENYDGKYSGMVSAEEALRRSLNVPMIRLLQRAGVSEFLSFLQNAGISSLEAQKTKLGLSLILGGCGVSLEELTGAYSAFASRGVFTPPGYLKRISSVRENTKELCSPAAAYMVTEILSGVNRSDLPNNFESSMNLPAVAFKTGTSYGRRDAWAIGYSAQYTVGVWIGNVTNRGNPDLVGSKTAAPILIDIFNSISSRHEKLILPMPRDIGTREVCALSGEPATPRCDVITEGFYSKLHTLSAPCALHKEHLVSPSGRKQYCPSCLGTNRYKVVTLADYPSELLTFWNQIGKAYSLPPPHNSACTRLFAGMGPAIVSPTRDMTYYLFSPDQKMVLQASSGLEVNEHIWYLDEELLGKRKAGEKLFVELKNGSHTVTCLDDKGRMSSVKIMVKVVM